MERRIVGTISQFNTPNYTNVPVTNYTSIVMGDLGKLDVDGILYHALATQQTVDITPTVSGLNNYTFSYILQPYPLSNRVDCLARTDPSPIITKLGVGETVQFSCSFPPYNMPTETKWTTSAGTILSSTHNPPDPGPPQGGKATLKAASSAGSATVTAKVRNAAVSVDFNVLTPSDAIGTITATNHYDVNVSGAFQLPTSPFANRKPN